MPHRTGMTLILVAAFTTAAALQQAPDKQSGARELFYSPLDGAAALPATSAVKPRPGQLREVAARGPAPSAPGASSTRPAPKNVGIHYWVELEGHGLVTDSRVFQTGERIRVHLRSNVDGYLELWSLDPSGKGTLLFPDAPGKDAQIKAGAPFVTPGYIRFTPPVQDERLLVFFSLTKTDLVPPKSTVLAEADVRARHKDPSGGRALTFEKEEKDPSQIGTYVVSQNGGPVLAEIRLKHVAR